ncbi:hypothetical protein D3C85_1406840 [compost metagenome]
MQCRVLNELSAQLCRTPSKSRFLLELLHQGSQLLVEMFAQRVFSVVVDLADHVRDSLDQLCR